MASTHPQASIILSPTDFGVGAYSDGGHIVVENNFNIDLPGQDDRSLMTNKPTSDIGISWRTSAKHSNTLLAGTYKFQPTTLNSNTYSFQPFAILGPNPGPNGIQSGSGQAMITMATGNTAWQSLYGYYPISAFCEAPILPSPLPAPKDSNSTIELITASFEDTGNSDTERTDGISSDNNFDLSVSSTISGVTYEISNDPIGTDPTNLQWRGTVANIRNLFDGYYRFRAKSGDNTLSNTITLTIDRTGPDFSLIKHGLDQPNDSSGQGKRSSGQEFQNAYAFAAILKNGLVKTWGNIYYGADSSGIDFDGVNNNLQVIQIFSTKFAFAALRSDGSVITWGDGNNGGDSSDVDFDGDGNSKTYTGTKKVTQIFSTASAFAALRSDGSVLTWGNSSHGGSSDDIDFDGVDNKTTYTGSNKVTQIFSTASAFAALRSDGSVITWGHGDNGGDSSDVDFDGDGNSKTYTGTKKVTHIFSTTRAFAALRSDGSVITWGNGDNGGDSSDVDFDGDGNSKTYTGTKKVTQIFSTTSAFAALRSDGSVITWGDGNNGGDSSDVDFDGDGNSKTYTGTKKVTQIFSTASAFAALQSDGSVITWGDKTYGGKLDLDSDSKNNYESLERISVAQIFSTQTSFAALSTDGKTVVMWGVFTDESNQIKFDDVDFDGDGSSKTQDGPLSVLKIFSTDQAYAALRSDGSIVTWGSAKYGGKLPNDLFNSQGFVIAKNGIKIFQIFSTYNGFTAHLEDGSVVSWGSGISNPAIDSEVRTLASPFNAYTLETPLTIESEKTSLTAEESTTITFVFREDPGSSFTLDDISVEGGSFTSGISGTGTERTATFKASSPPNNKASITVGTNKYTDLAGNKNIATSTKEIAIESSNSPTLEILSSSYYLKQNETATIIFVFREDPGSSFTRSDINVTNGILLNLTTEGHVRLATFKPVQQSEGNATISVGSNQYKDLAGNFNTLGSIISLNYDTLPPTCKITSSRSILKADETATITFTFSEDPGDSFTLADISCSTGNLPSLSTKVPNADGTFSYTATYTPAANTNNGSTTISVDSLKFTDAAGNKNNGSSSLILTYDTLRPTVTITSSLSTLKAGEQAEITFTFSEDPGDSFTPNDVTCSTGSLSAFSDKGAWMTGSTIWYFYTATYTPVPNTNNGSTTISVDSLKFTDPAGNNNNGSSSLILTYDTLRPTVTITSNVATLKAGEKANITFTFSEDPGTSFNLSDISRSNGTLTNLSTKAIDSNGKHFYTATYTPVANINSGSTTISVASAKFNDPAGNNNNGSSSLTLTYDTLPPTANVTSSSYSLKKGDTATITFTFSEDPGDSFILADVGVRTNYGTLSSLSAKATDSNGKKYYSATFTPVDETNTDWWWCWIGTPTYFDSAGNWNTSDSSTSLSFDTKRPELTITSNVATIKAGETATITFTFSENPGTTFTRPDITVSGGSLSAISAISSFTGTDGKTYFKTTATFTPTPDQNKLGTATISVADNIFTDLAGNEGRGNTLTQALDTRQLTVVRVHYNNDIIFVQYNDLVDVNANGGTPSIAYQFNGTTHQANYVGFDDKTDKFLTGQTLKFQGDTSIPDLTGSTLTIQLNNGTIKSRNNVINANGITTIPQGTNVQTNLPTYRGRGRNGTTGHDLIEGANNTQPTVDRLIGKGGGDTFQIRERDALIGGTADAPLFETIENFNIGVDNLTGRYTVNPAKGEISTNWQQMQILGTSLQRLTTNDIGNLLNATNFKAQGASAFTYGSRTFIALNNDTAGFQSSSDDIVEITGYSGDLRDLAIWKVL